MSDEAEVPESVVAGKYRLTRVLGRGGMGAVWEGVHVELGTRVAVKFIDKAHAGSSELRQRFVNEAKAAARLRSKHVVQVYDQGVTDDGRPYIVMEFLTGEPLDARLDRLQRLPLTDTASVLVQVARALTKAHDLGIVHRDLKPENIFLVWDDEDHMDIAKVVDFGIAKFTESAPGASSGNTRTGAVLGTPHYMSPEQARGLKSVDHRTDIWSLGVIAYRCLVGRLPFDGEAVGDLLVRICTEAVPVPSTVDPSFSPELDDWISKALSKDPSERFQTASELATALCTVAGLDPKSAAALPLSSAQGTAVRAQTPSPNEDSATAAPLTTTLAGRGGGRSRIPLFVAGTVVALVVGFAVARGALHSEPAPEPEEALAAAAGRAGESVVQQPDVEESSARSPRVTPTVEEPPAVASGSVEPTKDPEPAAPKPVSKPASPPKPPPIRRPAPPRPKALPKPEPAPKAAPANPEDLLGY